ncbi:MAG: ABC transporter permease [Deltaproteobacteria bacterium]|nr:ABC transporter permease [Deltaproteobacteria bacterium]
MISPVGIAVISANTVREAVRSRVLYTLLFFAVLLIGTGVLLSTLTYVERERILQSVGLAAIRLFGAAIAIFVGIGLIHREVERRTIYTILSKPISRCEFLLGKYLGLVATIWIQLVIMGLAFVAVSWLAGAPLTHQIGLALGLAAVELAVIVAFATLFSAFTTPMLAALFTTGLYVLGHLSRDLRDLGARSDDGGVRLVATALYRVLPDLESFNLTTQALHALPVSGHEVGLALLYGAGYCGALLALAVVVFDRRDFK